MATRKTSTSSIKKRNGEAAEHERVFKRFMAEPEGLIPAGMAERLEKLLTGDGALAIDRRIALTYLEQPFRETTEALRTNRTAAVALAHRSHLLSEDIKAYEALLGWLKNAQGRMLYAVCAREDSSEVFAEAKAAAA